MKSLAFSTTAEKLVAVMQHMPEYEARPGARLSMGCGFVGFRAIVGAKRRLKSIDGIILGGRKPSAKWAGRGAEDADKETVQARTAKMIVGRMRPSRQQRKISAS